MFRTVLITCWPTHHPFGFAPEIRSNTESRVSVTILCVASHRSAGVMEARTDVNLRVHSSRVPDVATLMMHLTVIVA
jgi:hypothetical protein